MEANELKNSGILELYVYGSLSVEESKNISELAKNNPEIKAEIESIEVAIFNFNQAFSPDVPANQFEKIKHAIFGKVIPLQKKSNFSSYLGWAAALIFSIGLVTVYINNQKIEKEFNSLKEEKIALESKFSIQKQRKRDSIFKFNVVNDICNRNIQLDAQKVSPAANAKIYWNKYTNEVFVDATSLPIPPKGKEYQIWSLKMQPLTPTSIGLLNEFEDNNFKFFKVDNAEIAEGFGITLEPEGGSATPTMEQLYSLGKV